MVDPISTVAGAVSAANGIIELTKTAITLAKKKNAKELVDIVQDIRERAQEIREENLDLRHQVSELKERLDIESKLKFDSNNLLWITENGKDSGPYCSQCKDSANLMVRLHAQPRAERGVFHQCPTCKSQPDIHALAPFKQKVTRVNRSKRFDW